MSTISPIFLSSAVSSLCSVLGDPEPAPEERIEEGSPPKEYNCSNNKRSQSASYNGSAAKSTSVFHITASVVRPSHSLYFLFVGKFKNLNHTIFVRIMIFSKYLSIQLIFFSQKEVD
jgi:hypothetical protein